MVCLQMSGHCVRTAISARPFKLMPKNFQVDVRIVPNPRPRTLKLMSEIHRIDAQDGPSAGELRALFKLMQSESVLWFQCSKSAIVT